MHTFPEFTDAGFATAPKPTAPYTSLIATGEGSFGLSAHVVRHATFDEEGNVVTPEVDEWQPVELFETPWLDGSFTVSAPGTYVLGYQDVTEYELVVDSANETNPLVVQLL